MKQFTIYFEFFGKKMKTTVNADNGVEAQNKVRERLNIVKVRRSDTPPPKDGSDEFLDHFKNMLGFN